MVLTAKVPCAGADVRVGGGGGAALPWDLRLSSFPPSFIFSPPPAFCTPGRDKLGGGFIVTNHGFIVTNHGFIVTIHRFIVTNQ